jgi:hypothetical protein
MATIQAQPAAVHGAACVRGSSRFLACLVATAVLAATSVREAEAQGAAKGALQGALIGGAIGVAAALMMPKPAVKPAPSSLDFKSVSAGTEHDLQVTIRGRKNTQVTIDHIAVSGSGFSLVGDPSVPLTIAPGADLRITIKCQPSRGRNSGTLEVSSFAGTGKPKILKISLKATGT